MVSAWTRRLALPAVREHEDRASAAAQPPAALTRARDRVRDAARRAWERSAEPAWDAEAVQAQSRQAVKRAGELHRGELHGDARRRGHCAS